MRYRLRDIPDVLRTPPGREHFRNGFYYRAWPLLRSLATMHRATFARRTKVVAVVGSLGKTTTTRTVRAVLEGDFSFLTPKNAYNFLAISLLKTRPRDPYAVLEVGIARQGEMAGYARMIRPDIAVVTSIASEHNRSLGTLETTREEKAEMVRVLPPSGVAVLNGDDPRVLWMAGQTKARVLTFGLGADNDVRAEGVELDWPHGTRFTLHAAGRTRPIRIRLIGQHMVYPALAAVAVALVEGRELDSAISALEQVPPTPMRLQPVLLTSRAYLLRDEFKSPLETVHAALDVLAQIPARRRFVVLGEISEAQGDRGSLYRDIGARVAASATKAYFFSTQFQRLSSGAHRAGMPRDALVNTHFDLRVAIDALLGDLGQGDVVLVKGRKSQRLERISLALSGRQVRCRVKQCDALTQCDDCAMLERGWEGRRFVI